MQLPHPAVNQQQIRQHALSGAQALVASGQRLTHGGVIIPGGNALNAVAAILPAAHAQLVIHHTRRLRGLAHGVADVETLDALQVRHIQIGAQLVQPRLLSTLLCLVLL